jgi:hypothetical protein
MRAAGAFLICGLVTFAAKGAMAETAPAAAPTPYPTFGQVPPTPKDVRKLADWKAAVLATKGAGAETVGAARATPWTLSGTEAFAAKARAEATPPPPVTTPSGSDAEAIAMAERARASAPPRRR